jgi:hypothetical protein
LDIKLDLEGVEMPVTLPLLVGEGRYAFFGAERDQALSAKGVKEGLLRLISEITFDLCLTSHTYLVLVYFQGGKGASGLSFISEKDNIASEVCPE